MEINRNEWGGRCNGEGVVSDMGGVKTGSKCLPSEVFGLKARNLTKPQSITKHWILVT